MNDGQPLPLYQKALCGLVAGGLGALVGTPADLTLIRMQAGTSLPICNVYDFNFLSFACRTSHTRLSMVQRCTTNGCCAKSHCMTAAKHYLLLNLVSYVCFATICVTFTTSDRCADTCPCPMLVTEARSYMLSTRENYTDTKLLCDLQCDGLKSS
jgi:hypothetical protein